MKLLLCVGIAVCYFTAARCQLFFGPLTLSPITGLDAGLATALGVGGVASAALIGGGLGAVAAAATNQVLGRGRSNNRRYRGRRDTTVKQEMDLLTMFQALSSLDQYDCAKRYLCELKATPEEERDLTGQLAVDLFQNLPEEDMDDKSVARFMDAVSFGSTVKTLEDCAERYAKCPAGPQTTVASLLLVETNTVVV